MMALMVLGMPPVYSCHIPTGCGLPLDTDMSEPRVCPPIGFGTGIRISAVREELDTKQWTRLPAVHCVSMQSSLSFMCGLDGRTRKVRYEKFRQPCGVQPAACWEALRSGRLRVGEAEYPTTMNQTRSHMTGEEGCAGSCKAPVVALERKIIQVLMEVLVEEDWIWWNEERNQVTTKSGKGGHCPQEWRSHPGGWAEGVEARRRWSHLSQSWRSKPSHRWGRDRLQHQKLVKIKQREEHGTARLLLQCSGGVCREGFLFLPFND
jgi:hypothetical protein